MYKKQTIRLNESKFNNLVTKIVKESVRKLIKESNTESDRERYAKMICQGLIERHSEYNPEYINGLVYEIGKFFKDDEVNYLSNLEKKDMREFMRNINSQITSFEEFINYYHGYNMALYKKDFKSNKQST